MNEPYGWWCRQSNLFYTTACGSFFFYRNTKKCSTDRCKVEASRACENLEPAIFSPLGFVITKSNEELLRVWGWVDRFITITPNLQNRSPRNTPAPA